MSDVSPQPFRLHSLPLPARLVIAVFLVSVGIGYFSALVQLHFQGATPGHLLPGFAEVERTYSIAQGAQPMSQLEQLLQAPVQTKEPFNGGGSMSPAFAEKSQGWNKALRRAPDKDRLWAERDGERLAVLQWIRSGPDKNAWRRNAFPLPAELADHPITADYVAEGPAGKSVKIQELVKDRCLSCHATDSDRSDNARQIAPMDSFEDIQARCKTTSTGGMSLTKLAQTTHVHLLGFAMLYGLTGLLFSFTSYPRAVRLVLAPLPLVAQLADISCWWLARLDPAYSHVIIFTGGIVAAGLFLHILGCLFDLFRGAGKLAVLGLIVAGLLGLLVLKHQVIDKFLKSETEKGDTAAAEAGG